MPAHRPIIRVLSVAVPLLPAAMMTAAAPAQAANGSSPVARTTSFAVRGVLNEVAAVSDRSAWTAGYTGGAVTARPLIARWNGSAWKPVPSPDPGTGAAFTSVAATSARNAWAVGYTGNGSGAALIARWNGTAWKQVPASGLRRGSVLTSVAATSARNAWAVGYTGNGSGAALIARWNGTAWKQVPVPGLPRGSVLNSVAAISARSAWAVGGADGQDLIVRWDGRAWKRVTGPSLANGGQLEGITATSARNAWAVGVAFRSLGRIAPQILRWNGMTWKPVTVTGRIGDTELGDVTATSAGNAWAVGITSPPLAITASGRYPARVGNRSQSLILHWNGTAWTRVSSPSPAGGAALTGVAATSGSNAWAVGGTGNLGSTGARTLILHWNGTAWK